MTHNVTPNSFGEGPVGDIKIKHLYLVGMEWIKWKIIKQ